MALEWSTHTFNTDVEEAHLLLIFPVGICKGLRACLRFCISLSNCTTEPRLCQDAVLSRRWVMHTALPHYHAAHGSECIRAKEPQSKSDMNKATNGWVAIDSKSFVCSCTSYQSTGLSLQHM